MLAVEKIVEELYKYLHEVLPSMSTERMVDLLEFIAIQNAGIAETVPGLGQNHLLALFHVSLCSPTFGLAGQLGATSGYRCMLPRATLCDQWRRH